MPAIKIFADENTKVPEGTEHEYECTLVDRKQAAVQYGAISAIWLWLDDHETNTPINKRTRQNVLNTNGGTVTAGTSGEAVFTLGLDAADALVVNRAKPEEQHRLTLEFTYTRAGGGVGTLTHKVLYRVVNLERINP